MIVHNTNEEVRIQVRGRYHGELPFFYYHDIKAANEYIVAQTPIPDCFLNVRLYNEQWHELCDYLQLRNPHGGYYSMPTITHNLKNSRYGVVKKKDSKRNGQYYYLISVCTKLENVL